MSNPPQVGRWALLDPAYLSELVVILYIITVVKICPKLAIPMFTFSYIRLIILTYVYLGMKKALNRQMFKLLSTNLET